MIYIKKSLIKKFIDLFLKKKTKILPNPMKFTYWRMTTNTIVLIGYPYNKNNIKS